MQQNDKLIDLFDSMVDVLLEKVKKGEATAAEMRVAAQLIKDAGIDVVVEKNQKVSQLASRMPFPVATVDRQEQAINFMG